MWGAGCRGVEAVLARPVSVQRREVTRRRVRRDERARRSEQRCATVRQSRPGTSDRPPPPAGPGQVTRPSGTRPRLRARVFRPIAPRNYSKTPVKRPPAGGEFHAPYLPPSNPVNRTKGPWCHPVISCALLAPPRGGSARLNPPHLAPASGPGVSPATQSSTWSPTPTLHGHPAMANLVMSGISPLGIRPARGVLRTCSGSRRPIAVVGRGAARASLPGASVPGSATRASGARGTNVGRRRTRPAVGRG
jgi:hypothetical protein